MGFEWLKNNILELARKLAEDYRKEIEETYGIELPRPPVEILEVITIKKQVGGPIFVEFEDIKNIDELRNSIIVISVLARIFGRRVIYSFRCFVNKNFDFTPLEELDAEDATILLREITDGKPAKDYEVVFERIKRLGWAVLDILERIIKMI